MSSRNLIKILLFAAICLTLGAECQRLTVNPLNSYLTDSKGRFIFYHGVNVVSKEFPFYPRLDEFNPLDSLSREDFEDLRSWGMKAIRLYISWQGFEPVQGRYNYTYLQKIKEITQSAKKYGIDIILDAHQDLFSRRFCGQGFPDWLFTTNKTKTQGYYAVLNFPSPLKIDLRFDKEGNPLKQDCLKHKFIKYYLSEDVMRFSQQFFTNSNGMADKFIRMWMNVVGYFKAEQNVIGYDLINEPSGANLWKNPYNYIGPGVNNNKYLLPFYKKLAGEIRKIDQEKLILFEPFPVDFIGGFYQSPSPKQYQNLDIFSYHTYCPFVNQHAEPTSETKCKLIDLFSMNNRHKIIHRLKCGSMMTEFGSVPESTAGLKEISRVLEDAEANWQNWFWWQFKYYNDYTCSSNPPWEHSFYYPDGRLQEKKVKLLSHPYAYAVCGTPIAQSSSSNSYSLKWRPKQCGGTYTEIYLNEQLYFPNGFTITFTPKCKQCTLESIGQHRSYYKVILTSEVLQGDVEIKVAGYI